MKVGRLRHRLILQRRADVENDEGEIVPSYELLANVNGDIEPVSGRELFAGQQVAAEITTRIIIRWRRDVDATVRVLHRINYGNSPAQYDVYDVAAALEDPVILRRWITLHCTKRGALGFRSGDQN